MLFCIVTLADGGGVRLHSASASRSTVTTRPVLGHHRRRVATCHAWIYYD
jgi:hypothetical protein